MSVSRGSRDFRIVQCRYRAIRVQSGVPLLSSGEHIHFQEAGTLYLSWGEGLLLPVRAAMLGHRDL